MALQLIKINEFPELVVMDLVEWMPFGLTDGEARKITLQNFINQLGGAASAPTFTDSSFDI